MTKIMELAKIEKAERDRAHAAYDAEMVDKAISRVLYAAERRFGVAPDAARIPNPHHYYAGEVVYEDLALSFCEGQGLHSFSVKTVCDHCGKETESAVFVLADIAAAVADRNECTECEVKAKEKALEAWDSLQGWQQEQAARLYGVVQEITGDVG